MATGTHPHKLVTQLHVYLNILFIVDCLQLLLQAVSFLIHKGRVKEGEGGGGEREERREEKEGRGEGVKGETGGRERRRAEGGRRGERMEGGRRGEKGGEDRRGNGGREGGRKEIKDELHK